MRTKISSIGFFLILLFLVFNGCVENKGDGPRTFYVDHDGGFDFSKIQNAINSASEGDTVIVHDGTYYEVLFINKSINLIGNNRETTIINNPYSSQKVVVEINAESCLLKGFKVIGPDISDDITGIHVSTSNNVISNTIIMNTGKGIYLGEDTKNNSVSNIIATKNREAISVYRSDNNNISNNEISINITAGISLSYGIFLHGSNDNIISGNSISQCYTGIRLKGSDNQHVYDNVLINNKRGAYTCCGAANNRIYHNNFLQNEEYNARDDIKNQWDNEGIGNYWDDYIEKYPDAVQINDIWDIPYNITSSYSDDGIFDRYPLINPI